MKYSKAPQGKKKRSLRNLFKKSKPEEERVIDTLLFEEDTPEKIEPNNEEITKLKENLKDNEKMKREQTESGIVRPASVVHHEAIYDDDISAKQYCDDLSLYLTDNGLSVTKSKVREMFSCMATSRLIIVKDENPLISERFIELFSEFIGAHFFQDRVTSELENFHNLFQSDHKFKDAFLLADIEKNRINITSLRNVTYDNLSEYFEPVMDYAWNPLLPSPISFDEISSVNAMPSNIWFMLIPEKKQDALISSALTNCSQTIELHAKIIEPKPEVHENIDKISFEFITNLLLEGYDKYFLEELEWKKIDKIEQYLIKNSSFKLDNRLFRQLERYTSTYLMFGGEKYEAMDTVLYTKLLPVISLIAFRESQDKDETLFQLFERVFGLEYLAISKMYLKEIDEKNRQNN